MGEVTGRLRLTRAKRQPWRVECDACLQTRPNVWRNEWQFARRIDAIAFARRKGIRLVDE